LNQAANTPPRFFSDSGEALTRALEGDATPAREREGARFTEFFHGIGRDAGTYAKLLQGERSDVPFLTAHQYVDQFLEELGVDGPLDRMLAMQLLYQHVRVQNLCLREFTATDPKQASATRSALDQAMNTFRRQTQALRDLQAKRLPGPGPACDPRRSSTCANELGSTNGEEAAVSAQPRGKGQSRGRRSTNEAVEALNGSADAWRENGVEPERVEARFARG